jgi:hypothetical protein
MILTVGLYLVLTVVSILSPYESDLLDYAGLWVWLALMVGGLLVWRPP